MRLLVHVEGVTEETFVNNVLVPHLGCRGYSSIAARLMGDARRLLGNRPVKTHPRLDPELRQGGNGRHCRSRHRPGQHPPPVPELRRLAFQA